MKMPRPLWALKSMVPLEGKREAERFAKKFGNLFRIQGVGVSPAGSPTVDLVRLKSVEPGDTTTKFQEYGNKITVEKLPEGIFINGKRFAKEW